MKLKSIFIAFCLFGVIPFLHSQPYLTNWYFGTGTDGIRFVNNLPQKLSDKALGVGFEGMIVVNNPVTGDLLFYSDGQQVINKNHTVMTNGTGLTGHWSGAQCVQSCPVPGSCSKKFYLFTNSAWDNTAGQISYSIVDFTTDPLGVVTNKNTLFWTGPSDQGMCLVSKPGTNEYWLIANDFNTAKYNVWPLTATGIGTKATYPFSVTGSCYQMNYDKATGKLTTSGYDNRHVTMYNFNTATGVVSNEQQIGAQFGFCGATRFSPDGSKLYVGTSAGATLATTLYQYDMSGANWINMNTCCYAHDLKMGPDGKMYFINTYYSSQPISVIDFPNATATGNACNYHTITFSPAFNGEVRRFPETVILPEPPVANPDYVNITGLTVSIPVLNNDSDPQGDPIHLDAIIQSPSRGTAVIAGNNINYTANANYCGIRDTLIYRIADSNCETDTALVIIKFPDCTAGSIINDYTPVLGLNPCNNSLTVEDATAFNAGDTVLLIQMKGAVIDSSNTAAFGTVTDLKNAGNYEYNYVKSKTGNSLELKNQLTRSYDIPDGKVQLVRVPYYNNLATGTPLTCLAWDGKKGGVLAFNVQNNLSLNADLDVSGKGFRGGNTYMVGGAVLSCQQTSFYSDSTSLQNGRKGEGIADISAAKLNSRGPLANGGGGGNGHNAGGGGGSNGTLGGMGGYQLYECLGALFDNRGLPGKILPYSNPLNKIYMGGGGGSGHKDGLPTLPYSSAGGNGGGIILINAGSLTSNGFSIKADGNHGWQCDLDGFTCLHDGMGGGGAGGAVLLNISTYNDNHKETARGGKGADVSINTPSSGRVGPGGGGSGGIVWYSNAAPPASATTDITGGAGGVITPDGNNPMGAGGGTNGLIYPGLIMPVDNTPFKANIDSVRFNFTPTSCTAVDFFGLAYFNTTGIASWQWYFGDGGTASSQNSTHNYGAAGSFTVKLVVTDLNGCKDSISRTITTVAGPVAEAGNDTTICSNTAVSITLHGSGGGPYLWSPAIYLNNPALANPVATISSTTKFYLSMISVSGCNTIDSVTITINPVPLVQTLTDTPVCRGTPLLLTTLPGTGSYSWTPAGSVSNPNIASPQFIDIVSQQLIVTCTNSFGCTAKDTVNVTVKPLPVVQTIPDTSLCRNNALITLLTNGNAVSYNWTPPVFLSNPAIASPVFTGNSSQTYYVTGTGSNNCQARDTVTITVSDPKIFKTPPAKAMCENSSVELDGYNGTVGVDYLWSPAAYLSAVTIINPVANPPSSRMYNVQITDKVCQFSENFLVPVTVTPKPVINAGKTNDIDCAHHSTRLFAQGGGQYLWTPATGLNDATISNPVATLINTQTYYVTVTSSLGCSNRDSVTVISNISRSLSRYLPNSFTPNGDGRNDCFGLPGWYFVRQLQFIIYNRWGELVFSSNNPNACWDGMYKGKKAEAGVYVYYVKAITDCGTEEQKGNVLLIR